MKIFLLDLWNDLREKRLWPVAVLLLAALVAVPVVLSKPSEEPTAAGPASQAARSAPDPEDVKGLATVKLDDSELGKGSSLDTFDPDNPFRPPAAVVKRSRDASADGSGAGPGTSSGSPDSSGQPSSSSPGAGDDLALPDTGGQPDTGTGDTGSDGGDGGTTTTQYTFVVDLTFTGNGRTRRIKGMERLDMLPSQKSPLLLFLGVTANAGNAVFLVDSTLEAAGEGKCKPGKRDCAFLHIGAGSEHEFTNADGDSYRLRIDEIRKVKVGKSAAASSSNKSANAAVGAPSAPRRFVSPLLADLVSVSSGGDDFSNDDRDSR